jgi:hypothetical protein
LEWLDATLLFAAEEWERQTLRNWTEVISYSSASPPVAGTAMRHFPTSASVIFSIAPNKVRHAQRYVRRPMSFCGSLNIWNPMRLTASTLRHSDIVRERQSVCRGATTARRLVDIARPWLRFLGRWRAPIAKFRFQNELDRYVAWMRDERGLSRLTVERSHASFTRSGRSFRGACGIWMPPDLK